MDANQVGTKLVAGEPIESTIVGTEDRVFLGATDNMWHWQARGTSACSRPFGTKAAALVDYHRE